MMKRILTAALLAILALAPAYADSFGSAVGGSAGNQSNMAGGICLTAPVALTNGQQRGLLVDCTTGALITEGDSSGGAIIATGVYKNVSVVPTVQNGSYTAGQSLGGLQTLTVLPNGLLQQVQIASTGGSVVGVWVYVWDKIPANSTCTDKTNFAKSQVDNQNLVSQPFLLTPSLGVSANDATTYAQQGNMGAPFVNADTSPGSSLYVCLLANATVTPGTTTDYRLNVQAAQ